MINDITLRINGIDFSSKLSKYEVTNTIETVDTVITFDGTEHTITRERAVINFTLVPLTDNESYVYFSALSKTPASVTYTNASYNADLDAVMNVQNGLTSAFGLRSVDGNRYYKGGTITLREKYAR